MLPDKFTHRLPGHTLQPFLVTRPRHYRQMPPGRGGISLLYQFRMGQQEQPIIALPDGCIDIVLACGKENASIVAYGPMHASKSMQADADTEYLGLRFYPGSVPALLLSAIGDLTDQVVPLSEMSSSRAFGSLRQLVELPTFEDRVRHILTQTDESLWTNQTQNNPQLYDTVVKLILAHAGNIKIADLAAETGYTSRYINKVFRANLGISPKEFCRQIRVQNAMNSLGEHPSSSLAMLAMNIGYFDQSHFIEDFKYFLGMTPTGYIRDILPALEQFEADKPFSGTE